MMKGQILSEFRGCLNQNTTERIFFVEIETGRILACLVSDELQNSPIESGDRVLIEFTRKETPFVWTTWSFCITSL